MPKIANAALKAKTWPQTVSLFHALPAFDVPVRGFHPNIAKIFGTEKLEWWAYYMVEKV